MINKTEILKDLSNKRLDITRRFNAPVEKVWQAWTDSALLDKWWAPRPWMTQTKSMDFRPGGRWLYCMAGPEGQKHWCRVDYQTITQQQSFSAIDCFCDENGDAERAFPNMHWSNKFSSTDTGAKVDITITFDDEASLEEILKMGFEGGFSMALGNLDELLAK